MELLKNKYFVNNFVQSQSCKISCADYCDDVSYMSSDLTGRDTPIRSCGCKAQRVLGRERQLLERTEEMCSEFKYHVVCLSFLNVAYNSHQHPRQQCRVIPWSTMLTLMCDSCLQLKNHQLVEEFDRSNPISTVAIQQNVLIEPRLSYIDDTFYERFPPSNYSGPIMLLKTGSGHACKIDDGQVIFDDLHPKNVIFKMLLHPSRREMYNPYMQSELEYFHSSFFNSMYRPVPQCCPKQCNLPFKSQRGPLRFNVETGALLHYSTRNLNGFDAIWGLGSGRNNSMYSEAVKKPNCFMCKQPVYKLVKFSDHEEEDRPSSPEAEFADLNIADPFEEDVLNWNAPRQEAVTPPPTFEVGEDQDGNIIYIDVADIPVSPFLMSDDEMPELSDEELLELRGYF